MTRNRTGARGLRALLLLLTLMLTASARPGIGGAVPPLQVTPDDGVTLTQFDTVNLKMQWCAPVDGNQLGIRILVAQSNATDANGVLASPVATKPGIYTGYCFLEFQWRPTTPGTYFWQVTNSFGGVVENSPIRTINVRPVAPMEAESPANGGRFLSSARFSLQVRNVPQYYDFPALSAFYVASSPEVNAQGELIHKIATESYVRYLKPGAYWAETSSSATYSKTPGIYYWQYKAVSTDRGWPSAYSPVFSFTITTGGYEKPSSRPSTARIPLSMGRQGSSDFRVNYVSNIPVGLSGTRFLELARAAGTRWGLKYRGTTGAAPGQRDGVNVVGFSPEVSLRSLGTTRNLGQVRRLIAAKGCRRINGVRKCRTPARWKFERELDVMIGTVVRWQQGPSYPTAEEYDLETVLIHEFGHVADFSRDLHFTDCRNSPMFTGMGPGEWWRGPYDRQRKGC